VATVLDHAAEPAHVLRVSRYQRGYAFLTSFAVILPASMQPHQDRASLESLTDWNMIQRSQVLKCGDKPLVPQARCIAEAIAHKTLEARLRCLPALGRTVSALQGSVREGSLGRTWRAKPLLDRRVECAEE
jgi:hypothetical protein